VSARRIWADYFDTQGLRYAFYSAADATARQESLREASGTQGPTVAHDRAVEANQLDSSDEDEEVDVEESTPSTSPNTSSGSYDPIRTGISDEAVKPDSGSDDDDNGDARAKVLSVLELEDLFTASAPDLSGESWSVVDDIVLTRDWVEFIDSSGNHPEKLVVGLVGYPNVGKSSTINSLLGEKKVSVSSTPGKTKHFQTINLSDKIILCDCPGLVFPQFATTKADLVCDGVLPIDQLREHIGPVSLVVRRIPKGVLEGTYGIKLNPLGSEEGGDGSLHAEDLLISYAGWLWITHGSK
jgi:large subunit GTPase 1